MHKEKDKQKLNEQEKKSSTEKVFQKFPIVPIVIVLLLIINIIVSTVVLSKFSDLNRGEQVSYYGALICTDSSNDNIIGIFSIAADIIGSFIAVVGALHIQKRIDKKSDTDRKNKYACIVYYDIKFALRDILKIFNSCDKNIENTLSTESLKILKDDFKNKAKNKKLYFSPNWFSDVAQICDNLNENEIEALYDLYGILHEIDRAFSNDTLIDEIYESHICKFVTLVKMTELSDDREPLDNLKLILKCKNLLDKSH